MSSLRKNFATNADKEITGVKFVAGINDSDGSEIVFYIARSGGANSEFGKELERLTRPYRSQIGLKTLPADTDKKIYIEAFASSVIKGWDNVSEADISGNAADTGYAPFTKQNAVNLLTALPELFDMLKSFADEVSNFRDENKDDDAKN